MFQGWRPGIPARCRDFWHWKKIREQAEPAQGLEKLGVQAVLVNLCRQRFGGAGGLSGGSASRVQMVRVFHFAFAFGVKDLMIRVPVSGSNGHARIVKVLPCNTLSFWGPALCDRLARVFAGACRFGSRPGWRQRGRQRWVNAVLRDRSGYSSTAPFPRLILKNRGYFFRIRICSAIMRLRVTSLVRPTTISLSSTRSTVPSMATVSWS